jgi:hypothetical protein
MIKDKQDPRVLRIKSGDRKPLAKRMSNKKFVKIKLEKDDILDTKRKLCCGNLCLQKLETKGICMAQKRYLRLKPQQQPLSLQ